MKEQLKTLYSVTGDIKDINTLLVPREQLEAMAGEPVQLDHIACIDGGKLRYMTGRKAPAYDCELYAMPDGKRAPNLYAAPVAQPQQQLEDIEQYRMQMAGISTAAMGYWKEGDSIHPDYDTPALRDVAKLYSKYDALYKAQQSQAEAVPRTHVLVPKRMTRAMDRVTEEEGWTWEDLLAAAEAITEAEYSEIQMTPAAPQQAEAVPPTHVQADAERYRWLRDKSVPPHNFYISVPEEFHGVRYQPHEVDAYIDAAIAQQKGQP